MISEKFQSMILWIWEQLALFLSVLYHLPNYTFQYLGYNVEDEDDNYEEMQSNKQGSIDDADNVLSSRRLLPRKMIAKDSHKSNNDPKHDRRKSSSTVSRYLHQSEEKVETQLITENNFGNMEDIYKLQNPYCIVIVNINIGQMFTPRNGGEADFRNIENLLSKSARFQTVKIHKDCTRIQVLEIIEDIAKSEETKHHDGLVCFISSHGSSRGIRTVDRNGHVAIEELTTRLNAKQCKALRGKPKLLFIQACRGRKIDRGVPASGIEMDADHDGPIVLPKLPIDADFLICYSAMKGYLSYRRYSPDAKAQDPGSWFISVLTTVFKDCMQKEDLMQMMARVNAKVADMATGDDHVDGEKQMPCQMHMLRKRVVFGNHWNIRR